MSLQLLNKKTMNLQNIQSIAYEACFSKDSNTKFEAQRLFMEFVFKLDVPHYIKIMEGFSQTVLFVFLSYLDKKVQRSNDLMNTFHALISCGKQWMQSNGQFRRNIDQQCLKSYVSNTFGMVLGRCMKHIYIKEDTRKQLIQYLITESNSLLKLFLYKNMIEIVSTIDNEMEYVQYRSLVCSFQEKMIPQILNELYPFFISITDTMKVNQLSSMIPRLGVERGFGQGHNGQQQVGQQHQGSFSNQQSSFELFREDHRIISQLVFTLLSEIVNFKYNITFSEYDLQTQFQNIMVSFPQSILSNLTSKQFLQAFYFMLQKMCLNKYTGSYLDCSFECLKKILLSKVTHFSKQERLCLVAMHYYGLMRVLAVVDVSQQKLTNQIFQCLYKFIHAFEFTDMTRASINHLQLLEIIKQKVIIVISTTSLTSDNLLYQSATSLMFKIASQAIAISQQKYIAYYEQLCRQFYVVFLDHFLLKGDNICGKVEMNKIATFKSTLEEFFFNVNRIASMDMKYLFQLVLSKIQPVLQSNNDLIIANFFYLVTDICQENFYDRSLVYDTTKDEDLILLGEIVHKCFQFIDFYKKSSLQQLHQSSRFIELSILLFFEKILTQCLQNLSNSDESITILSKTYKVINSYKLIPANNEQFLLFCFRQLMQGIKTQDPEKVEYILQVLYNLLLKLKFSLKRQLFIQSHICKQILQEMIKLSCDSLQSSFPLLKLRRKLFKIITTLSFDDLLDTYRTNINFVIEAIEHDFYQQNYAKVIFDLSGICDNIDTPVIYRYFLSKIDQNIGLGTLLKTLYESFGSDLIVLQEVISLNRSMLTDKALRMTNKHLSLQLYLIIDHSLSYLSTILLSCQNESWSQVMRQTYQLGNVILDSSYVNLFLVRRKSQKKFIEFMYNLSMNVLRIHNWAIHYPELQKQLYQMMRVWLVNCVEITLVYQQPIQIMLKFSELIQCVMYYVLKKLQELVDRSKDIHLSEKLLQAVGKFFSFLKYKRNFIHREILTTNIQYLISNNSQYTVQFLQSLYKLAMGNLKNFSSILNSICICIMEISYFYPYAYLQIFKNLGISQDKVGKFGKMYHRVMSNQDDPFFVINLREWLAISDTKDDEDIDY